FGRWSKFWERKKAVEELALTPEQISQLEEIDYKFSKASIELQAKAKTAQLTFDYLVGKGDLDEKKLADLIDQIGSARKEQVVMTLQRLIEARRQLTPEQWVKVERMLMKGRGGREMKGGEMKGGGKAGNGPSDRGGEGCPMMGRGMMGRGMPGAGAGEGVPPAEK
ncbi:MAG: Spy/CpxP family protein refolding chaperone, partial [Candidatus Aureabacteria bacterium]|nr:Spy/CpxP family protein refolding chaperone [Candidatus Auribacterota bacterium]